MARGPYRDAAEPIADDEREPWPAVEHDEEIGPVIVRVNYGPVTMASHMPQGLRVIAALAGLGLLVILGMVAFSGS